MNRMERYPQNPGRVPYPDLMQLRDDDKLFQYSRNADRMKP